MIDVINNSIKNMTIEQDEEIKFEINIVKTNLLDEVVKIHSMNQLAARNKKLKL